MEPDVDLLRSIPAKWASPPPESIAKRPKGGNTRDRGAYTFCNTCRTRHAPDAFHLDYMGHAEVTLALLELDPLWSWEPVAFDMNGLPLIEWGASDEEMAVMWIRLTVGGHSRLGVGSVEKMVGNEKRADVHKELVGDALRNAAMRFGIGTNLWSKAAGATGAADARPQRAAGRTGPTMVDASTGERHLTAAQVKRAIAGLIRTHQPEVGPAEMDDVVGRLWEAHKPAGAGPWPEHAVHPTLQAVQDALMGVAA